MKKGHSTWIQLQKQKSGALEISGVLEISVSYDVAGASARWTEGLGVGWAVYMLC